MRDAEPKQWPKPQDLGNYSASVWYARFILIVRKTIEGYTGFELSVGTFLDVGMVGEIQKACRRTEAEVSVPLRREEVGVFEIFMEKL